MWRVFYLLPALEGVVLPESLEIDRRCSLFLIIALLLLLLLLLLLAVIFLVLHRR